MGKKRTLVKIDDTVMEVEEQPMPKCGIKVNRLTDDQIFDEVVLNDSFESMLHNDFNKLANQAYKEILERLKTGLRATVLRSLGFEDNWGRGFKVDHCNSRMSTVSECISEKVKSLIRSEADSIMENEKENLLKEVGDAIKNDFREQFMYHIRRSARDAAENAAEEFLKSMMSTEFSKYEAEATAMAKAAIMGQSRE